MTGDSGLKQKTHNQQKRWMGIFLRVSHIKRITGRMGELRETSSNKWFDQLSNVVSTELNKVVELYKHTQP